MKNQKWLKYIIGTIKNSTLNNQKKKKKKEWIITNATDTTSKKWIITLIFDKPYIKIFSIGIVFESIRKSLSPPNNQVLFIFLHVDEINIWNEKTVNPSDKFFKNMINELAHFIFLRGVWKTVGGSNWIAICGDSWALVIEKIITELVFHLTEPKNRGSHCLSRRASLEF